MWAKKLLSFGNRPRLFRVRESISRGKYFSRNYNLRESSEMFDVTHCTCDCVPRLMKGIPELLILIRYDEKVILLN